jgi:hypothetical protein
LGIADRTNQRKKRLPHLVPASNKRDLALGHCLDRASDIVDN